MLATADRIVSVLVSIWRHWPIPASASWR